MTQIDEADDHEALMRALEAPDPPATPDNAERPIRDALAPLAFSPRRVIEALHDAAKTCGALHDARKELRRRLLALLFDGEPLRVRATGSDLRWDDDDQSDVQALLLPTKIICMSTVSLTSTKP